ncbi:MAG: carbon-nitrogen hydrolase family protein [Desulfobacterales bacterium]|nr:carbon-nitrogen hydrolase family protein [Desulfobacterales bacterium]
MKLTVCELSNNWINDKAEQEALFNHLATQASDFLLLPEMPFAKWLAGSNQVDPGLWEKAVVLHEHWISRLEDFDVPLIAGTRPILKANVPHNEGFIWTKKTGAVGVHEKYYLPDEEGFWEATWYRRGNGRFDTIKINGICIGFLICSEIWFNHWAREYSKGGMDILVCPRATPVSSTPTWKAGAQAAANVSGAYCLSSNFNGPNTKTMDFGGTGWIAEPEEGNLLGTTSNESPFLTLEVDIDAARDAKKTYPRYIKD